MRSIIVLTVICLISGVLLSWVNGVTAEQIKSANSQTRLDAVRQVFTVEAASITKVDKDDHEFFELYDNANELIGVGVQTSSSNGYAGEISIIVGITTDCKISDYRVLTHKETPGLGDKITTTSFKEQFKGKSLADTKWLVKKDGGDIDAITAATISSRAVTGALENALKLFEQYYAKGCK